MRGIGKYAAALFILCLIVFEMVWWHNLPDTKVSVHIPAGATAKAITVLLKENGLISSKTAFYVTLKLSGRSKRLKSGLYEFTTRDGFFKIIDKIASGKSEFIAVNIPEGFTAVQIADRLAAKKITDRDKFLKIVNSRQSEGYLFPDTYQFQANLPAEDVVAKMLWEFDERVNESMRKRAEEIKGMDLHKIITLASIIEKEARVDEERPHISAVFYNRLKKRMYLESCATVQCALGIHKEKLTYEDTRIDSPYNTYRNFGLPPGPICNPGLSSIRAALYPIQSDDLFFVVSSSGTHSFSKYYKQHLEKQKRKKGRE